MKLWGIRLRLPLFPFSHWLRLLTFSHIQVAPICSWTKVSVAKKKHYQPETQRFVLKLRSCLQKLQGKAEVNLRMWADTLIVFIRPTLLCSPSCDVLYTLEVPAYSLSHALFHLWKNFYSISLIRKSPSSTSFSYNSQSLTKILPYSSTLERRICVLLSSQVICL